MIHGVRKHGTGVESMHALGEAANESDWLDDSNNSAADGIFKTKDLSRSNNEAHHLDWPTPWTDPFREARIDISKDAPKVKKKSASTSSDLSWKPDSYISHRPSYGHLCISTTCLNRQNNQRTCEATPEIVLKHGKQLINEKWDTRKQHRVSRSSQIYNNWSGVNYKGILIVAWSMLPSRRCLLCL